MPHKPESDAQIAAVAPVPQDPFIKRVITEDPLFRFLFKWRRPIIWLAAAAAAVVYVQYYLDQSRQESRRRGADLYADVRKEMKSLEALQDEAADLARGGGKKEGEEKAKLDGKKAELAKSIEDSQARLSGKLSALGDQKPPYNALAKAYRALAAARAGEAGPVEQALKGFDLERSFELPGQEGLFVELPALLLARSLLDSEAGQKAGRETLRMLAEKGRFARVAAALTLAGVAESEQDRSQALALLQEVKKAMPEQGSLIEGEIERLQ